MFDGVFEQELHADGHYQVVEARGVDVAFYAEVVAMTYLHHGYVVVGKGQFVGQGDLFLLLHDVAVGQGQLLEVAVGTVVVDSDEAVEGVERVEEEVGVYLVLEGVVSGTDVLGLYVLFFQHQLLTAGDVEEQEGDEYDGQGHKAVFDHADVEQGVDAPRGEDVDAQPPREEAVDEGYDQRSGDGPHKAAGGTLGEAGQAASGGVAEDVEAVEEEQEGDEQEVYEREYHLLGAERDDVAKTKIVDLQYACEYDARGRGHDDGVQHGERVFDAQGWQFLAKKGTIHCEV